MTTETRWIPDDPHDEEGTGQFLTIAEIEARGFSRGAAEQLAFTARALYAFADSGLVKARSVDPIALVRIIAEHLSTLPLVESTPEAK